MRQPVRSVGRLPAAAGAGQAVAGAFDALVQACPELLRPAAALLKGEAPQPFTDSQVHLARATALQALQASSRPPPAAGLCPEVFDAWVRAAGDPDDLLAEWLRHGAPLGVLHPVEPRGVFPPVDQPPASPEQLRRLVSHPAGWSNYRSAEDDPGVTADILQRMVRKGWASATSSWEHACRQVGSRDITLNKLALITKTRPDGSVKHRLIWDLLRSQVNAAVRQGERVILPRISDVVGDAHELRLRYPAAQLLWFGTDVADAFHQVPLRRDERRFTVVAFQGVFYIFKVLVFGSASAPTVWGRYAAFVGRSTAAILHDRPARLEIYVDDPLAALADDNGSGASTLTLILLWFAALGLPLAWAKCEAGRAVTWIGARLSLESDACVVTVPDAKRETLIDALAELLRRSATGRTHLRSLAGHLSFVAGLVPTIRPFLASFWAVAYDRAPSGLPAHLVHCSRLRNDASWLLAFLRQEAGAICRAFPWRPRQPWATVTTDASPWGMGGILSVEGRPAAYFATRVSADDLVVFNAQRGESGFTTTWEMLAILIAARTWACPSYGPLHIRSDSLASLSAAARMASSAPGLSLVLRELALLQASDQFFPASLTHIPGVANDWADALSRLSAPEPRSLPPALAACPRARVPARGPQWYRALAPPTSARSKSLRAGPFAALPPRSPLRSSQPPGQRPPDSGLRAGPWATDAGTESVRGSASVVPPRGPPRLGRLRSPSRAGGRSCLRRDVLVALAWSHVASFRARSVTQPRREGPRQRPPVASRDLLPGRASPLVPGARIRSAPGPTPCFLPPFPETPWPLCDCRRSHFSTRARLASLSATPSGTRAPPLAAPVPCPATR